jgi:hypothetical protein
MRRSFPPFSSRWSAAINRMSIVSKGKPSEIPVIGKKPDNPAVLGGLEEFEYGIAAAESTSGRPG